jgi:hypothetical protein
MSKYICSRTNYNKVDMHINIWVMSINIGPRRNYKKKIDGCIYTWVEV